MGTSIIDGVKSPGDIKKSYLFVINLNHLALSRLKFIRLGYLHETCHKLPPLDDLGVPNKPASPSRFIPLPTCPGNGLGRTPATGRPDTNLPGQQDRHTTSSDI